MYIWVDRYWVTQDRWYHPLKNERNASELLCVFTATFSIYSELPCVSSYFITYFDPFFQVYTKLRKSHILSIHLISTFEVSF